MKCSILIPCFNAEKYIRETLHCAINQGTDVVGEIIVIDDHSRDASRSIALNVANNSPHIPIRVFTNTNKGAASARNQALNLSRFEAIQWLDADDLLSHGKIRRGLELLNGASNRLVASNWVRFYDREDGSRSFRGSGWQNVPHESHGLEWLTSGRMTALHSWLGHRSLFARSGGWRTGLEINQDGEYMARVLSNTQSVMLDETSQALYRSGLENSTSSSSPSKDSSLLLAATYIESTLRLHKFPFRSRHYLAHLFAGVVTISYPRSPQVYPKALAHLSKYGSPRLVREHLGQSLSAKYLAIIFGWRGFLRLRHIRHQLWASTRDSLQTQPTRSLTIVDRNS